MYLAMSIGATGLLHQQRRIDTIANNVANANTVGYKNARLDFKDALYTTGVTPGPARTPEGNQQKGHGVLITAITRDFKPGSMERTDNPLDFAIENEGFFAFEDPNGGILYGRNGAFSLSVEADGTYLVNGQGLYVLNENEERITIPFGITQIIGDVDGTLRFVSGDIEVGRETIGIYTFRNLHGLVASGNSTFTHVESAGERLPANDAVLRQGVLEISNISLAEEMTRLIRTQRAFQLASRAVTTADEMEGIANNMKR